MVFANSVGRQNLGWWIPQINPSFVCPVHSKKSNMKYPILGQDWSRIYTSTSSIGLPSNGGGGTMFSQGTTGAFAVKFYFHGNKQTAALSYELLPTGIICPLTLLHWKAITVVSTKTPSPSISEASSTFSLGWGLKGTALCWNCLEINPKTW